MGCQRRFRLCVLPIFLTYFWRSRWCAKKWWPIKINSNSFWFLSIFYVHHEQYIVMTIKQLLWTPLLTWIAIIFRSTWFLDSAVVHTIVHTTDYGRPVRKSPSLHGQKSTPNPKFLGTAKAYFVCHIGPIFQISLIYAFIGCPLWQYGL